MNQNKIVYRFTSPITVYQSPKENSDPAKKLLNEEDLFPAGESGRYQKEIDCAVRKRIMETLFENPGRENPDISACLIDENFLEKIISIVPRAEADPNNTIGMTSTVTATSSFNKKEVDSLLETLSAIYSGGFTSCKLSGDTNLVIDYTVSNRNHFGVSVSEEQQSDYEYKITTPIHATFYPDQNIHQYASDDGVFMESSELVDDEEIVEQLENLVSYRHNPQETLFGLASYFDYEEAEKVLSVQPALEIVSSSGWDELVLATTVKTNEPLSESELQDLKAQLTAQLSDGWGEWLGQQAIHSKDGEYYIHVWDSDDKLFTMSEELTKEPDIYSDLSPETPSILFYF